MKAVAAGDDRVVVATDRAVLLSHNFADDEAPSECQFFSPLLYVVFCS